MEPMTQRLPHESPALIGAPLWSAPLLAIIEPALSGSSLPFLLLLLGISWFYLYRQRRNNSASNPLSLPPPPSGSAPGRTDRPSPRQQSTPGQELLSGPDEPPRQEQLFFPDDDLPPRFCPRCERNLPGVFEACPYDHTPLQDRYIKITAPERHLLDRNFCLHCGRRYHLHVDFCHHDGAPLARDDKRASETGPPLRFCRSCGLQTDKSWKLCPRDGEPLELLEPARWEKQTPIFPIMHCQTCGHIGGPGAHRCPQDHSILMPMESTHLLAMPDTGFGPRRHLCRKCGETFSDHCHFCCHDGSELVPMN